MSKETLKKIQENSKRLDSCPVHEFIYPRDRYLRLSEKLTCRNCGGEMDAVQAFRYCQGYKAAGGNPCEIIEGFE